MAWNKIKNSELKGVVLFACDTVANVRVSFSVTMPTHAFPLCLSAKADFVLGNVCLRHQKDPINPHVCQCCSKNYAFRRECFSNIEGDDGYAPPPCAPELFTFHEDLCTASAEAKEKKHRMLVDMVKCKPTITFDQMKNVTKTFYGTVEKCCKAENHEACVIVEGPKMEHQALTALH